MVELRQERTVTGMMDFLYHLPETVWKTIKVGVCLVFVYAMTTTFILPGLTKIFGF